MAIEKNYQIWYELCSTDIMILKCLERKNNLITISKRIKKAMPVFDEQIILAHILNVATKNNYYFSKGQIRTCFNKNYHRDFQGDKQSYLSYLYGLMPNPKGLSGAITRSNKAILRYKKTKDIQTPSLSHKIVFPEKETPKNTILDYPSSAQEINIGVKK